jgi:hypothetical protein
MGPRAEPSRRLAAGVLPDRRRRHDAPVQQLATLADPAQAGVLSDYEFAVAKKLLDERWES